MLVTRLYAWIGKLMRDFAMAFCISATISWIWKVYSIFWTPHPHEYGGYLPLNDIHPDWPDYIAPRDAYPKNTSAWLINGFELPPKNPVKVGKGYSKTYKKLGGKSKKTKEIRSLTPRGFSKACFLHMEPILMNKLVDTQI